MKKFFIIIITALVLLPIAYNSPNKIETKKYYAKTDSTSLYLRADPGGGG
ncbi:hypothetical protein [Bacillus pseudomycoides]|nr:hypothetical protein [Bacillus pseudomycoides]MCR8860416.1 hypothetical protein [Bacillus pseudomycoides]